MSWMHGMDWTSSSRCGLFAGHEWGDSSCTRTLYYEDEGVRRRHSQAGWLHRAGNWALGCWTNQSCHQAPCEVGSKLVHWTEIKNIHPIQTSQWFISMLLNLRWITFWFNARASSKMLKKFLQGVQPRNFRCLQYFYIPSTKRCLWNRVVPLHLHLWLGQADREMDRYS